jgi:transcriptional regulator with XRE-family HTH domain
MSDVLPDDFEAGHAGLGGRLRAARVGQKLTLRELARRTGISPSLVSQIETGKVQPSVKTLYAIATELGVSLDAMFGAEEPTAAASARAHVVRAGTGPQLELESGVRWEQLESWPDLGIEARRTRYEPGSTSSADGTFLRHSGREFGLVLEGTLTVAVGFDEFVLATGDAISFDSTIPHLLRNDGAEAAHALWLEVGRFA